MAPGGGIDAIPPAVRHPPARATHPPVRTKRGLLVIAMWVAAIAAMAFILMAREPAEDPPPAESPDGSPVRVAGRDEAPPQKRAHLPTRPPEPGPPRSYRLDRRHTARSPYVGPSSAELRWAFETEGRITGQAVVDGEGNVYFGSHDGHLYAVSRHGTLRWKRFLGDRVYSTPLVDDEAGRLYVGSDANTFWALSTADGEVQWRLATEDDADTGVTRSSDGKLFFASGKHLYAVHPDGTVEWRFEARSKIYSTPAVDDDGTIYVGSQDDHLYAVAPDGRMRWSYETRGDVDASPVIGDDGTIYFGSDDRHVYAVTRDGALRWSAPLGGYVRAPLALGTDRSVLAGVYGPRPRVVSLDAATGDVRWFFPVTVADSSEIGVHSGPLVDREGQIYFGAHDDYLYALAQTGELRWIFEASADVDGSPVLAPDGTLYVGADDGRLYALHTP